MIKSIDLTKADILHTLILNARLNPLAKNPPKGPMTEAKMDMKNAWIKIG